MVEHMYRKISTELLWYRGYAAVTAFQRHLSYVSTKVLASFLFILVHPFSRIYVTELYRNALQFKPCITFSRIWIRICVSRCGERSRRIKQRIRNRNVVKKWNEQKLSRYKTTYKTKARRLTLYLSPSFVFFKFYTRTGLIFQGHLPLFHAQL